MIAEQQQPLISLLCDSQYKIIEFIRDELGISKQVAVGHSFTAIVDSESLEKALNFLVELRTKGATFDWPLAVPLDRQLSLLHFAGGISGNDFFIIGAKTSTNINQLHEELMKINNEQVNMLRKTIKEQMLTARAREGDSQLYEELTKVNNELANTQRELAKKNVQLEQQRKKLEVLNQELQATIAELQRTRNELVQSEKMASLGRLVSGFAHEINTPIGIALTAASMIDETAQTINTMLAAKEVSETELTTALDKLSNAGQLTVSNLRRAGDLVTNFKRTSIDQTMGTKRLFGLQGIIQDIILSLDNKFRRTSIKIELTCPTDLNIYGDPGAISQILTNLLINSLIHGFEDGQQAGTITIHAYRDSHTIHLDYTDTGKGMDKEALEKLFEPFYTTRRARGGTGLGMYICYNLVVTRLKGTITCESELGEGSIFHISFPIETIESK
jgi:signal transduction histidine kinase